MGNVEQNLKKEKKGVSMTLKHILCVSTFIYLFLLYDNVSQITCQAECIRKHQLSI